MRTRSTTSRTSWRTTRAARARSCSPLARPIVVVIMIMIIIIIIIIMMIICYNIIMMTIITMNMIMIMIMIIMISSCISMIIVIIIIKAIEPFWRIYQMHESRGNALTQLEKMKIGNLSDPDPLPVETDDPYAEDYY